VIIPATFDSDRSNEFIIRIFFESSLKENLKINNLNRQLKNNSKINQISEIEKPKIEEPKQEEHKIEEPKQEEHKIEEPKQEEHKIEEHKNEEHKIKEHKNEEHKIEELKIEEHKFEELKIEEHKADEIKDEIKYESEQDRLLEEKWKKIEEEWNLFGKVDSNKYYIEEYDEESDEEYFEMNASDQNQAQNSYHSRTFEVPIFIQPDINNQSKACSIM
jgi:hypothetical protein